MANDISGSAASADVERPVYPRQYSNSHRFFGESRVTPRHTPRGTPSASRANSVHNVRR